MRGTWLICVLVLLLGSGGLAGCGDNIRPATPGPDASTGDANVTGAVCGDGQVSGDEQCDDALPGDCCSACTFVGFGNECRAASGDCNTAEVCSGLGAECPADATAPNGTTCPTGFCQNGTCETCNTAIDADFDGSNQCLDCDDTNGLVLPGATEKCDGVDDDCDARIDETFDMDADTYSVCSDDPLVRDCDDLQATTNPGAPELCGAGGTGNGRDDNCNGFIDETCGPCDPVDHDGDGASECMGDCDDTLPSVGPGKPELCDGRDNDCNAFTTENCGVSDPCNFASGADVCRDDLQCGCVVGETGQCTGDYRCASFCEGSFTGPTGAGCTATQTCRFRWTLSDNQHACAETTEALGIKLAGETCDVDTECRSGDCDNLCVGPGCQQKRCIDYCDHHAPGAPGSCAAGTVCELLGGATAMYSMCQLDNNGTRVTGESCSLTQACLWGAASCVAGVCAQPCGDDGQCPTGFHCSLRGTQVAAGVWGAANPVGVAGQPAMETVPVCLADAAGGAHDRIGGAACTQNAQCVSEFCDGDLGVCVDPCVSAASCGAGLACEPLFLRARTGGITWGRACVNGSFGPFLEAL
ncbi:MAG: hypothetical protein H0X17_06320 [Deltaproteobacteria bacterium]|nr:hypothetical protein [Deltaproteobacteria bacterium]